MEQPKFLAYAFDFWLLNETGGFLLLKLELILFTEVVAWLAGNFFGSAVVNIVFLGVLCILRPPGKLLNMLLPSPISLLLINVLCTISGLWWEMSKVRLYFSIIDLHYSFM